MLLTDTLATDNVKKIELAPSVCEFHITSHLLCLAFRGGATNSLSHILCMGVSYS